MAALDQIFVLLKTKDDTSKFVGLSLMKSLLDSQDSLRDDPEILTQCWKAIPTRWLHRLLIMKTNPEKRTVSEEQSMRQIAVGVVQAFATLLPLGAMDDSEPRDLMLGLSATLSHASNEMRKTILEAMASLARWETAAKVILGMLGGGCNSFLSTWHETENGEKPVEVALVTTGAANWPDWYRTTASFAKSNCSEAFMKSERPFKALYAIDEVLSGVHELPDTDQSSTKQRVQFVEDVFNLIQKTVPVRPNRKILNAATRVYTKLFSLQTEIDPFFPRSAKTQKSDRPFSYTYISLVIVDIKATIPGLMEMLASESYPKTALQIAADYDVLGRFIFSLLRSMEDDDNENSPSIVMDIPPDLLLKLRKDIAEAMSLTIEFFRDRWDASISGTAGLHTSAREAPAQRSSSSQSHLSLTWDNPVVTPATDPIILAGLRTLGIWLREDDNDQLRKEAAGIFDILMGLYHMDQGPKEVVLIAAEGIVATDDGVHQFLEHDGANVIFADLVSKVKTSEQSLQEQQLIISMARVLLAVVESAVVSQSRESWLYLLPALIIYGNGAKTKSIDMVIAFSALGHLTGALLSKAPTRFVTGYKKNVQELIAILGRLQQEGKDLDADTRAGLLEVQNGLREGLKA